MLKVSRERIYKECEGMIVHAQCRPCLAFVLLFRLNLFDAVLPVRQLVSAHPPVKWVSQHASILISLLSPMIATHLLVHWSRCGMECVCWLNVLLQRRAVGPLTTLSAAILTQPHPSTSSAHIKALYWSATIYSLAEVMVMEKKKEVPFHQVGDATKQGELS
jgi:hypothetical protein